MERHFIYILFSHKINKFYIGYSADINGRLERHNRATKGFTASGKPWQLVYSEEYPSKHEALIRETQLENWKNSDRIKSLIKCEDESEHPD